MKAFVRVVSLETCVLKSPVDRIKIESSPFEPERSVSANFVKSGEMAVAIISFSNVRSARTEPESDSLYKTDPNVAKTFPDESTSIVRIPASTSTTSIASLKKSSLDADAVVEQHKVPATTRRTRTFRKRPPVTMS